MNKVRIKLKTRNEIEVFGAMLRWAYEARQSKHKYKDYEEQLQVLAISEQLASLFQKVAMKFNMEKDLKRLTVNLTLGSACAMLTMRGMNKASDPLYQVIMDEVNGEIDRQVKGILNTQP